MKVPPALLKDLKVYDAFRIWNDTVQKGTAAPDGIQLTVATTLSVFEAPRDAVCLALLDEAPRTARDDIQKKSIPVSANCRRRRRNWRRPAIPSSPKRPSRCASLPSRRRWSSWTSISTTCARCSTS